MRVFGYLLPGLLCLAGLSAAQDKPATAPRRVVRVRFEGSRRYDDEFLKEQIATKEGQVHDPGLLARDERALREYFSAVTDIEENDVEGGVEIVFHVVDRTVVGKVSFPGLARVKKKDFEPLLSTRSGRPLHEHSLESDRQLIERMHREKGYRFAEVTAYRKPTSKPDVEDIVFQVITGDRVRVKRVVFEGAHSASAKELSKRLRNSDRYRSRYLTLGRLFDPSFYDRAAIDEDRRRIEIYYEQEGWLDVKAVYVETRFDEAREYADIRYRVQEGSRYRLRSFKAEYASGGDPQEADRPDLSPARLEALSELEPGEPFRHEDRARTRRAISSRLWSHAYAISAIEEKVVRDTKTHEVDLIYVVTAGPKVRQGRLIIHGNTFTRDNVIRRQFRKGALPGDYLNIEALEAARTRLMALRYFSKVQFGDGRGYGLKGDPKSTEPDVYDVELEVEETDTRQFSIGAGISTDGGAFGQFSVTWRNFDIARPPSRLWDLFDADAFRGGGQQFTLSAAPGSTFSTFTIAFSDPAVRDSRWSLSTSVSRRIALFDDYDQTIDGINVRVGRYLDEAFTWNLSFSWSLRQVLLDNPDPDAPVNALDQQGTSSIHEVGVSLRRSKRREADAFLNGHASSIDLALLGGPLGAQVDVFKVGFTHAAGWRIYATERRGWHRLRVDFDVNWAGAFGDSPEVPIFERFFLGGRNLRGFEYREVGPRSNGRPTGGEFLVTLSTQYTIPITGGDDSGFSLDLVFFLDQGGLTVDAKDFSSDDWRIAAGFGLAVGFGAPGQPPLLIDFGFPLRDRPGDGKQVLSVAFSRDF